MNAPYLYDFAPQPATAPTAAEVACWYTPWRRADASWLRGEESRWMTESAADELLLRARYPAWCARFSLPLHPSACERSIWWRLYALESAAFAHVSHLAALVLAVAADRRNSLLAIRRAAALLPHREDMKWAMQRASLVPKTVLALGDAGSADELARRAAACTAFAVSRAVPCLVGRMALRYPRGYADADSATAHVDADEANRCARWLERLWSAAFERITLVEET